MQVLIGFVTNEEGRLNGVLRQKMNPHFGSHHSLIAHCIPTIAILTLQSLLHYNPCINLAIEVMHSIAA